ncbi:MAG: hypothetical protein NVSMB55_12550 [Mycobacteriales bacterium]
MSRRQLRGVTRACLLLIGYRSAGQMVPLYDGVGFPDEPYRYVRPPAGVTAGPAPMRAHATAPAVGGTNSGELDLQTAEQGPQLLLVLPPSTTAGPSSATRITVTATPLAPDTQPADGTIDGNIYRITVDSDAGPATFGPTAGDSYLYLRAASTRPAPPVMEHRLTAASPWTRLRTGRGGADVLLVSFKGAGDYALVHQRGAKPVGRGPSQESILLLLVGGFMALVVVALLLVRRGVSAQGQDVDG